MKQHFFRPLTLLRQRWLGPPIGLLIALLQRTPVIRAIAGVGEDLAAAGPTQILRAVFTAGGLGAMHSMAGATQFVGPAGPVVGTVGTPLQVAFSYSGAPSSPARFDFTGSLPPGLRFIPEPSGSTIPSGTPVIAGTPTQAGSYSISVQGFNASGLTNNQQETIAFQIAGLTAATPTFTTQPSSQTVVAGGTATLSAAVSGAGTMQWRRNGSAVAGATSSTLSIASTQPENTGLYTLVATGSAGTTASSAAIVGLSSSQKIIGSGDEVGAEIKHPNGNIFDQILLQGAAATIVADSGQVTRTSYIDLNDDIVQVEFAGAGSMSLVLDGASGPSVPLKYNQSTVNYMKGHVGIVITGANETTNVSIFSVGRATAFDPTGGYNILVASSAANVPANNGSALFVGHTSTIYDGVADVAFVAITSTNGKFGGLRSANASYFATKGLTGVYAPGIEFTGPVFIGDIRASDDATPVLRIGSGSDVRITGGDLAQDNDRAVQVSGLTQLLFAPGSNSHGALFSAQSNRARLDQNGTDVTSQVVVNP
jgi:Immunoglobulin I-set domain